MKYDLTRTKSNHNTNLALYDGAGVFGIPEILPEHNFDTDTEFVAFNYALGDKKREKHGVHFFVDDYQFDRVWNNPEAYINMFKQYKYVLSPDFSMYTDWPKAIQIYNHYRKHWVAAYLQECGVTVIPTVGWSDESSFEWCFDGEPRESIVAVCSRGCANSKANTEAFNKGFLAMMETLNPTKVLCFGKYMDIYNQFGDRIVMVSDNYSSRLENLKNYNKKEK